MKRYINKAIACLLCAMLVAFGLPATALATAVGIPAYDQSELVQDQQMGVFDEQGHGYTDISILTVRTDFHIVDQSPTWTTDDAAADIWVQVAGGVGPYEVTWWRQLIDSADKPVGEVEVVVNKQAVDSSDSSQTFSIHPTDLVSGATYLYWAEVVAQNGTDNNKENPIRVINKGGFYGGPLTWYDKDENGTLDEFWTWSVEGFLTNPDGTNNGVSGAINKRGYLSANVLGETSLCRQMLQQAAAADGYNVECAWRVAIADTAKEDRAYIDDILVRLDITEYVQEILNDTALTDAEKQQAIERGISVWHLGDTSSSNPRRIGGVLGDNYNIYIEQQQDGTLRAFASFVMGDNPYGASGDLGCFAVAKAAGKMYKVVVDAPSHGQVYPAATSFYSEGATPSFLLYPDVGYKVAKVTANGVSIPFQVNWCDLPPITRDVDLKVEFEPAKSFVDPVPENFKVQVKASASEDDEGKSAVTLVAHGRDSVTFHSDGVLHEAVEMPAMDWLTLNFAPAVGFAAKSVNVVYSDGQTDVYKCSGNTLTIPALLGDATIEVQFEPAIEEPQVTHKATLTISGEGASLVNKASSVQAVDHGGFAVFELEVAAGYSFAGMTVKRAGVQVDDSAAVYEQDGQHAVLYVHNILNDVEVQLLYECTNNGDDPLPGTDPEDNNTFYNLTIEVKGGHGYVSLDGETYYEQLQARVKHNSTPRLYIKRDFGYSLTRVTVNGQEIDHSSSNLVLSPIVGDTNVVVEFDKVAAAGTNSSSARAIRTLTSLAKTGDLNAPIAAVLVVVACVSLGGVVFSRSRKREQS